MPEDTQTPSRFSTGFSRYLNVPKTLKVLNDLNIWAEVSSCRRCEAWARGRLQVGLSWRGEYIYLVYFRPQVHKTSLNTPVLKLLVASGGARSSVLVKSLSFSSIHLITGTITSLLVKIRLGRVIELKHRRCETHNIMVLKCLLEETETRFCCAPHVIFLNSLEWM